MSLQRTFPFAGGLNLAGITLALKPGEAVLLDNWECAPQGGYRRYDGYERYDGHPEPHLAIYSRLPFGSGDSVIAVGNTVSTSGGASAHVLAVETSSGSFASADAAGELIVDRVVGMFSVSDVLLVGSTPSAVVNDLLVAGSDLDDDFDDNSALAADSARALIAAVPGSGIILGTTVFQGFVHAFRNAADGATACMYVESPTGWVLKKSGLTPSGRYRFKVENFNGAVVQRALYGVSGVHKAFQWDGTTWTDIPTLTSDDRPTFVESHNNTLWLAFRGGSLQGSSPGLPLDWTALNGALEFAVGDEITGLRSIIGTVLAVYGEITTRGLYGSSDADYQINIIAPDAGAFPDSIQNVPGKTFAVDARGIMPLTAVQSFGDFETASVSQKVQPVMDLRLGTLVDSAAIRAKSAYRIYYADGTAISVTLRGATIIGSSILRLPINVACAGQGKRVDDTEIILIGGTDGFVYRSDVGTSFDGVAIDALMVTAPDAINGIRQIKQFQSLLLQIATTRPLNLLVQPIYDYELSPADISQSVPSLSAVGNANDGAWDIGNWDEVTFDSEDVRAGIAYPSMRIDGAAEVVQVALFHGGEIRPPFTMEAGIFVYRDRGFRRG